MVLEHPIAFLPVPAWIAVRRDNNHANDRQIGHKEENQPQDCTDGWQPPTARGSRDKNGIISHDVREKMTAWPLENTGVQCGFISRRWFNGCFTGKIVHPTRYFFRMSSQSGCTLFTCTNSFTSSSP